MTSLARFPTWMLRALTRIPALSIAMPTTVGLASLELWRRDMGDMLEHGGVQGWWVAPIRGEQ